LNYQGAGRRPPKENLLGRVLKILGRHRRLFDLKFDGTLTYSLNREAWEYENAIAGRFLLVTTSYLEAGRVMESYKELCKVERAFGEIEDFLGVRPIYHSEDRRGRA
jgi:hypothetical protein